MENEKNIHAGLAVLLILLLIITIFKYLWLLPWTIGFLVILMIAPKMMSPFTKVWFLFSEKLNNMMSKIILTMIFYGVVYPMSIIRNLLGADTMQFKKWKKNSESVFVTRTGNIVAKDVEKPY